MRKEISYATRNSLETTLSELSKSFAKVNGSNQHFHDSADDIIKEGIIQRFEFTHELAWKVMKDFLELEGIKNITGSRSATREAFNKELIRKGQAWMDMIESRNITILTYDENILEEEFKKIVDLYSPLLSGFEQKMESLI